MTSASVGKVTYIFTCILVGSGIVAHIGYWAWKAGAGTRNTTVSLYTSAWIDIMDCGTVPPGGRVEVQVAKGAMWIPPEYRMSGLG